MAKVEMDLAELDKIRENLKNANLEIEKQNQTIKQKDEEIVKVIADKRTVKVISKQVKDPGSQYFASSFSGSSLYDNDYILEHDFRILLRGYANKDLLNEFKEIFYKHAKNIKSNIQYKTVETKEYINFDDVIFEIRNEVEAKVLNEINEQKASIDSLQRKLNTFELDAKNKLTEFEKQKQEEINTLIKDQVERYNALVKDYEDLKADKDTRTLEQQILDLKEELQKEKSKKWYQKL